MNSRSIVEPAPHEATPSWQFDAEVSAYFRAFYQRLKSNAPWARVVGVTSCGSGEGVSTVASRLAIAAAEQEPGKVLLVDANPRADSAQHPWSADPAPGLFEVARGTHPLDQVLRPTALENLSVLPLGSDFAQATEVTSGSTIHEIIQTLGNAFPFVVMDLAPADQLDDALALMTAVDGVILVVEAECTKKSHARAATLILSRVRLLGTVLNKRQDPR
jgi:Mrp family chromosome partitioning ATPase